MTNYSLKSYLQIIFFINKNRTIHRTVFSIQAETERYDIVHFARVTTMSLVSGTGF